MLMLLLFHMDWKFWAPNGIIFTFNLRTVEHCAYQVVWSGALVWPGNELGAIFEPTTLPLTPHHTFLRKVRVVSGGRGKIWHGIKHHNHSCNFTYLQLQVLWIELLLALNCIQVVMSRATLKFSNRSNFRCEYFWVLDNNILAFALKGSHLSPKTFGKKECCVEIRETDCIPMFWS